MFNNKFFPFERNRFYSGKLLTSADFKSEQTYFNDKRNFLNKIMFGSGIVCGMGVYNLDDLSLMIESGVGIDFLGREIVVEKSVVKRLSSINGFDKLTSDRVSLCISYDEQLVHPVYSVNKEQANKEYEFNRISEGYSLFLKDCTQGGKNTPDETDYIIKRKLYSDLDYTINICVPSKVSEKSPVKITAEIEKLSQAKKEISIDALIQAPAFESENGGHEINVKLQNIYISKGEKLTKEFLIMPIKGSEQKTNIIAKASFVSIKIDNIKASCTDDLLIPVEILPLSAEEIITKEIGKISLESYFEEHQSEYIIIADLELVRTDAAYIIENVIDINSQGYIKTFAQKNLENRFLSYFGDAKETLAAPYAEEKPLFAPAAMGKSEAAYATGVCEIPIGLSGSQGSAIFSDEIMHKLGSGNVYVSAGLEYFKDDAKLRSCACNVLYGDADIFPKSENNLPKIKTAVKVMNERGTFIVGIKLLEDTSYVSLKMRWAAFKLSDSISGEEPADIGKKQIFASPSTVVLAPKETYCFEVKFKNMEPANVRCEIEGKDGGEITPDGIYTAPNKAGVYEIKISCVDNPFISTYAYAIVKKKGDK